MYFIQSILQAYAHDVSYDTQILPIMGQTKKIILFVSFYPLKDQKIEIE